MPAKQRARRRLAVVPETTLSLPQNPYARCRTLGHAWDPIPVTKPAFFGATIDLRCEHCTTIRRDIVRPTDGKLLSRAYSYPEDYRYERTPMQAWRSAWIRGLGPRLIKVSEDDD